MSVQLILYPQIASLNEFMVDALNFDTVNSSLSTNISTSGNPYTNIMSAAPPTISGAWYRFKNTINGSPAQASASGGSLTLNSVSSSGAGTLCGVYQQLSGLVIGESYTITVNMATANGFIVLSNYSGQIGVTSSISANATQASSNFTALSNNDTIFISYLNTSNDDLVISSIAVTGKTSIKDWEGQAICDLYENEEIPLTLSVDNFKNVAEKIQSYSKDFNLPATKRNNKLFGNIFDITRTIGNPYDFNPYAQTRAVLKQDGFILFDGFLKLIDIQEREGEISYNVNLYAQTIALADTLKDRTFDFIDFSELEHTYSKVAIKASWYSSTAANGLPLTRPLPTGTKAGADGASVTQVLVYPFVDWTGQILIANGATGNNSNDGFPELTTLEQAFRPFIKIKYLIDRIFSEAGYTYSSTLFESTSFGKLFMDFNWGGDGIPSVVPNTTTTATYPKFQAVGSPPEIITDTAYVTAALIDSNSTGGNANSNVPSDYVTAAGANQYRIVCSADGRLHNIDYRFTLENTTTAPAGVADFRWVHYDDDAATTTYIDVQSETIGGINDTVTFQGNIQRKLDQNDLLYPEFAGSGAASGSGNWLRQDYSLTGPTGSCTFNISTSTVTSSVLNSLRGDINQWEFLKGIFTMFNLVTLQDKSDPNNIIIKTYSDVFIKTTKGTTLKDRSINFDWTDKVDLKDIKLTPLNDLKKRTIFRYEEEEDDYIFRMYKKSTRGHLYGSKVFSAQGLTLLEGDDEIVATPFAATVSKPLGQGFNEMIVPTIYSMNDDGTTSTFDNMPRILYNHTGTSPVTMGSTSYYIPEQNGGGSENSSLFFSLSHLTNIPTIVSSPPAATETDDYNFGEAQYIQPIGQTVTSNLFNNYWLPYYNQLYNPDTKTMTLKVNLTAGDIAEFEFSDYVMIKNRAYRVNRIDYKPKDLSTVEFILIT